MMGRVADTPVNVRRRYSRLPSPVRIAGACRRRYRQRRLPRQTSAGAAFLRPRIRSVQRFAPSFRDELTRKFGAPVDLIEVSLVTPGGGARAGRCALCPVSAGTSGGSKAGSGGAHRRAGSELHAATAAATLPGYSDALCGVDARTLDRYVLSDNDTVVASNLEVNGYVRNILDVLPNHSRGVVVGASPSRNSGERKCTRVPALHERSNSSGSIN